jgi:hypothetical protein
MSFSRSGSLKNCNRKRSDEKPFEGRGQGESKPRVLVLSAAEGSGKGR